MKKSCSYCGRIHDSKYICSAKPIKQRIYIKDSQADKFRTTRKWREKANDIKERDNFLCQICKRKLYNTIGNQYNYTNIEVHHIDKLCEDYDRRLDNNNLISLCAYHHRMADRGEIPKQLLLDIVNEQESKY